MSITKNRVAEVVERRARRIVSDTKGRRQSASGLHFAIAQEIELALERLEHVRRLHAQIRNALLEDELRISADLDRVERLFHGYTSYEATLKARRLTLEHERRRLAVEQHQALRQVEQELLELVQRYEQVAPHEEH